MKFQLKRVIAYLLAGAEKCPEETKAHLTRCDMFYKCEQLPSNKPIWIAQKCPNGLIYDAKYKSCAVAGEAKLSPLFSKGKKKIM